MRVEADFRALLSPGFHTYLISGLSIHSILSSSWVHLRYLKILSSMSSFPQRRIIQAPSLPYCQKEKYSLSWFIWLTTKSFLTLITFLHFCGKPNLCGRRFQFGVSILWMWLDSICYCHIWIYENSILQWDWTIYLVLSLLGFVVEVTLASFIKRIHYHLCPRCFLYCTLEFFSGVLFPPPASCWAPPSPGDEGDLGLLPDSLLEAMIWTLEFGGSRSFLDP